ncbi:hypothetical protein VNI00_009038 [Paramarasmius palmivorus]|uniref:Uncharacterized protein n=1 Tax=Paramarasmius palmivorus TaxID=297713 RepID=A0AAW0CRE5_9AGAR
MAPDLYKHKHPNPKLHSSARNSQIKLPKPYRPHKFLGTSHQPPAPAPVDVRVDSSFFSSRRETKKLKASKQPHETSQTPVEEWRTCWHHMAVAQIQEARKYPWNRPAQGPAPADKGESNAKQRAPAPKKPRVAYPSPSLPTLAFKPLPTGISYRKCSKGGSVATESGSENEGESSFGSHGAEDLSSISSHSNHSDEHSTVISEISLPSDDPREFPVADPHVTSPAVSTISLPDDPHTESVAESVEPSPIKPASPVPTISTPHPSSSTMPPRMKRKSIFL